MAKNKRGTAKKTGAGSRAAKPTASKYGIRWKWGGRGTVTTPFGSTPIGAAGPPPAQSSTTPAPAPDPSVAPFLTAEDMAAINEFTTDLGLQLADLDAQLGSLESQTTYQKEQVARESVQQTAATQDNAAARGVFQSSIKDAAIYDIEAQKTLQQKFLDDQLTRTRLDAGTRKRILQDSKTQFDTAMVAKKVENARAIAATLPPAQAATPAPKPVTSPKPAAGAVKPGQVDPVTGGTVGNGTAPKPRPNTMQSAVSAWANSPFGRRSTLGRGYRAGSRARG